MAEGVSAVPEPMTGGSIATVAVLGGLITIAAGTVRIYQLRRAAKRNLRAGL